MQTKHFLPLAACVVALTLPVAGFAKDKGGDNAAGAAGVKKEQGPMTAKQVLKRFDKDSNGQIAGEELDKLRKMFGGKQRESLKAFDTNNDGTLDDAEVAAIATAAQAPAGGKGKGKRNK